MYVVDLMRIIFFIEMGFFLDFIMGLMLLVVLKVVFGYVVRVLMLLKFFIVILVILYDWVSFMELKWVFYK